MWWLFHTYVAVCGYKGQRPPVHTVWLYVWSPFCGCGCSRLNIPSDSILILCRVQTNAQILDPSVTSQRLIIITRKQGNKCRQPMQKLQVLTWISCSSHRATDALHQPVHTPTSGRTESTTYLQACTYLHSFFSPAWFGPPRCTWLAKRERTQANTVRPVFKNLTGTPVGVSAASYSSGEEGNEYE